MVFVNYSEPDQTQTQTQALTLRYLAVKRAFDVFFSGLVLVCLAPLFLFIILCILFDGGAPIFVHQRVGRNGEIFGCFKFRTMARHADEVLKQHLSSNPEARSEWESTRKLSKDPRITALGRFLRKSSLDELPQFWNVILGQMSVVGPRPITKDEMSEYEDAASTVTSVLPGITGLWQVSGRNGLTLAQRREMDIAYVQNASFALDVRLILQTVGAVLRRSGQ